MVCTRLPTAFLVLFRGGFTWREQVFIASSWIPKVSMVPLLFLCNLPTLVNAEQWQHACVAVCSTCSVQAQLMKPEQGCSLFVT